MTQTATMAALVSSALKRYHDAPAIITEDGRVETYAQLRERVWRLGHVLTSGLGLAKGARVGVLADNCPEYIELDFACALVGLVKVPLYVRNAPAEHVDMIEDADVDIVFLEPRFAAPLAEALNGVRELRGGLVAFARDDAPQVDGVADYEALLAQATPTAPDHRLVSPEDPYHIRYTGGTTGRPKGALTDHGGMLTACLGNLSFHGLEAAVGPRDVFAHVMGFSHVDAYMIAGHTWAGATHLPVTKFDPERFLALTAQHRVSISMMAPAMIAMLLSDPSWVRNHDVSSLATISYGGSPIPESVLAPALEAFGPIFAQAYGSTEAPSLIVQLPKRDHLRDPALLRSCGFAMPWVDVQILDEHDEICAPGDIGEVGIRSRSVLVEYIRQPDATAAAKANGWFHSGDIGRMDEDGYIYLLDRKSDVIISGGYNIYPAEVENALSAHPDIVECAVMGTPHDRWGETVSAVIRLREGASMTLLDAQVACEQALGSYKKPRRIKVGHDPLPRSEHGKLLRRAMRDQFVAGAYEGD
jgi:acyl-CoA synthetase (AMP-forming)/AMP-acid ligase II